MPPHSRRAVSLEGPRFRVRVQPSHRLGASPGVPRRWLIKHAAMVAEPCVCPWCPGHCVFAPAPTLPDMQPWWLNHVFGPCALAQSKAQEYLLFRLGLLSLNSPEILLLSAMFIHQPPLVYISTATVISKMAFRRKILVCSPRAVLTFSTQPREK